MADTPQSVRHVLDYLEGLGESLPQAAVAVLQTAEGNFRIVTVEDLVDLVRRAVLLDSMAAEIDRQGAEIARLRSRLPDEPGIIDYP